MIDVANRQTWENYFKQDFIKNCDVLICKNVSSPSLPSSAILTKDNIGSFKIKETNLIIPTEMPTTEVSIKIVDWKNLSNDTKTYLSTKGNYIRIYYCVENTYTQKGKVAMIDNVVIDRIGFTATITCVSPFREQTAQDNSNINSYGVSTMPPDITFAEKWQLVALAKSSYVYIDNIHSSPYSKNGANYSVLNGLYSYVGQFDLDNIYEDYVYSVDDNDKSNVLVYGVSLSAEENFDNGTDANPDYHDNRYWFTCTIDLTEQYANIRCEAVASAYGQTHYFTPQITVKNNQVVANVNTPDWYPTMSFHFYGCKTTQVETPENDIPYIKVPSLVHNSADANTLQTQARKYWGHKDLVSFNCRLDPTIECCDSILIGDIGLICIEEYELTFNGGFRGRVKGRVLQNANYQLTAPDLEGIYMDEDEFGFDVLNQNGVPVELVIVYSSGEIRIPMDAGESNGYTTEDELADILDSYYAYQQGVLYDTVYCYFESPYGQRSNNVILLEANE